MNKRNYAKNLMVLFDWEASNEPVIAKPLKKLIAFQNHQQSLHADHKMPYHKTKNRFFFVLRLAGD